MYIWVTTNHKGGNSGEEAMRICGPGYTTQWKIEGRWLVDLRVSINHTMENRGEVASGSADQHQPHSGK